MLPLAVSVILSVLPVLIAMMTILTGQVLSDREYQSLAEKKALSQYHETGVMPSSVSVLGRQISITANSIDTSYIRLADYKKVNHTKATIEQAIVNTCVTLYQTCGRDSRMQPVYNALRYANLASNYSVRVEPDKNGYLRFDSTITGGGNGYVYWGVWNGSYTIQSGDKLVYDVYVPSGLTEYKVGNFEFDFSDGTAARQFGIYDQNSIHSAQGNLSAYAGKWYHREFNLANVVGKSISYFDLVNESDTAGVYNGILYKNIAIVNSSNIKLRLWDPSYLFAFLDSRGGKVSDLLTTGTTVNTIDCNTATEADFEKYGRYLVRNALGTVALPAVVLDGVTREFYYTKPTGGAGCGYTDIVELR